MNRLGKAIYNSGVSSQRLSEAPIVGPFYNGGRQLVHGSYADGFIKDVRWLPVEKIKDENGLTNQLPEARGNPDTPSWADLIQRRKKTAVVVWCGIEELERLADNYPEGMPAMTVRFEDIALAGLFPGGLSDLGVSRNGEYYQAAAREGQIPFQAGLTIHDPDTRVSYTPIIYGITKENVSNGELNDSYPGTPLV